MEIEISFIYEATQYHIGPLPLPEDARSCASVHRFVVEIAVKHVKPSLASIEPLLRETERGGPGTVGMRPEELAYYHGITEPIDVVSIKVREDGGTLREHSQICPRPQQD